jgi:hypothetical protein
LKYSNTTQTQKASKKYLMYNRDNQIQQAIEYLAIGDYSGQITLMEVLRLFSEEVKNIFND